MRRLNLVILLGLLAFAGWAVSLFFRLAEPAPPHDPSAAASASEMASMAGAGGGGTAGGSAGSSGSVQQAPAGVPQAVGNLLLTGLDQGPSATAMIDRLHGKSLGLTKGYEAVYGDGAEAITVWVAITADATEALRLTAEMTARISDGNDMFTKPQPMPSNGLTLYQTQGMGQIHFYYAKGPQVIWVALPARTAAQMLPRVLEAF